MTKLPTKTIEKITAYAREFILSREVTLRFGSDAFEPIPGLSFFQKRLGICSKNLQELQQHFKQALCQQAASLWCELSTYRNTYVIHPTSRTIDFLEEKAIAKEKGIAKEVTRGFKIETREKERHPAHGWNGRPDVTSKELQYAQQCNQREEQRRQSDSNFWRFQAR